MKILIKKNRTQGDVKIYPQPLGYSIIYSGGQPIMDQGLENAVTMLLYTAPDWPVNHILPTQYQIGSDLSPLLSGPITVGTLRGIEVAAEAALAPLISTGAAASVEASAVNRLGHQIVLTVTVYPPDGGIGEKFELSAHAGQWGAQWQH